MRKVGTLTSGLTLLALGILILIDMVGKKQWFYKIIPFWPVILVGLGLEVLWHLFEMKRRGITESVRIDARSLGLLSLVGVFAIAFYTTSIQAGQVQLSVDAMKNVIQESFGEKVIPLPDLQYPVGNTKRIELNNRVGKVQVVSTDGDQVKIRIQVHVKGLESGDAQQEAKKWMPQVVQGTSLRIEEDPSVFNNQSKISGIDFQLEVPKNLTLQIVSYSGDLSVTDYTGDILVNNQMGKVSLERIRGNIQIAGEDTQVDIRGVTGSASVHVRSSSIDVNDLTGSFDGTTQFGDIQVAKIGGTVSAESKNGRVILEDISGDATVKTQIGDIQANGMKGGLQFTAENGNINIESEVRNNWNVSASRGMISLKIPKDSNIQFVGETNRGIVKGPTKSSADANGAHVSEKMGAGTYSVKAHSDDGAITVTAS
jgi:hypothetical protein